jgi:predicted short-subunit dehydrogenase-like oxidoreductase (DUF2520 family)
MEKLRIVLLGAGNVGWHLAAALEKAGHEIVAVYSRTGHSAAELAATLPHALVFTDPDFAELPADLFLIAVPDKTVPELLQKAVFPQNSLVAHTSGALPLSVFDPYQTIRGAVFYPLQTFSKNTPVHFRNIPFCLETADENAMHLLEKVAGSLSEKVIRISSEDRKILHLAAVFACNFTNHLFGIGSEILKEKQLAFDLLQPLVEQTVSKAFARDPFTVQTGPAVRHDENTMQAHLNLLENKPTYSAIYELLSGSIQEKAGA